MTNKKAVLAIAVGDPHGVGSEVILKSLGNKDIYQKVTPVVISDMKLLEHTQKFLGTDFKFRKISKVQDAKARIGQIDVLHIGNINWEQFHWGQISEMSGRASLDYIETAMKLAMNGDIDAFVHGPLNKENMKRAGLKHDSGSEYMRELVGSRQIIIFLIGKKSIITRVTTHVPFKEVQHYVTKENILNTIKMTDDIMKRLGFNHPRIGVGALNPHMGEGGLCGHEEIDIIEPAIKAAKEQGIEVVGLYPSDTLYLGFDSNFHDGKLDVGIYMYHDIAAASSKMLESGHVGGMFTMTAGLPVPVFSVGHGTAYLIAGKGEAKEASILNALQFATKVKME